MPRLIQTAPVGLLSALTSKDGGIGPAALLDEVRGQVDLLTFYGLNFRRSRLLTKTAAELNAAGVIVGAWYTTAIFGAGAQNLVVPSDQLWHCLGVQVTIEGLNGAVRTAAGLCFKVPITGGASGNDPIQVGPMSPASSGTTRVTAGSVCDTWLAPGGAAGFFFDQFALGLTDCNLQIGLDYEVFTL